MKFDIVLSVITLIATSGFLIWVIFGILSSDVEIDTKMELMSDVLELISDLFGV